MIRYEVQVQHYTLERALRQIFFLFDVSISYKSTRKGSNHSIIRGMDTLYSIQQITEITGLSAHTLRYYEKIGLVQDIYRDAKGYRQYTETDILWLDFLMRLKETGMPIREMKKFADLRSEGETTVSLRKELLEHHYQYVQSQIRQQQHHLAKIVDKVQYYATLEEQAKQN